MESYSMYAFFFFLLCWSISTIVLRFSYVAACINTSSLNTGYSSITWVFWMVQQLENVPAMQKTQEIWIWSLGWKDPLGEDMATWSNILAWRIPWSEESIGLPFVRLQSQTQLKQLNTFYYIHIPQCVYQQHIHLSIDIWFLVVTNKTALHIYV